MIESRLETGVSLTSKLRLIVLFSEVYDYFLFMTMILIPIQVMIGCFLTTNLYLIRIFSQLGEKIR